MANNFRETLLASDLKIGQRLIDATAGRWADAHHSEREVEVVRATKTRLVLALVTTAGDVTDREIRVVVRDGAVTSRIEGGGQYAAANLYTPDDEALAIMRAYSARLDTRIAAQRAAEHVSRDITPDKARAAIEKLQAYLASHDPDED